jgi:hypothetical protein
MPSELRRGTHTVALVSRLSNKCYGNSKRATSAIWLTPKIGFHNVAMGRTEVRSITVRTPGGIVKRTRGATAGISTILLRIISS